MRHRNNPGLTEPSSDPSELGQRLKASGAGYLAVDRLVGHSAVASVFAARDVREGRPVTLKLVDSDLAYDVGAPAFVRGIGSTHELRDPHVLAPASGAAGRGAIYYLGPYAAAEPLHDHLAQLQPIRFADALLIAVDTARAVDRWHSLGLAHGEVRWETLLIQSGQVLLRPPSRVSYSWDARCRDVQGLARFFLDLLDRTIQQPEGDGRWQRLRAALVREAEGSGPLSPSAGRLGDKLMAIDCQATPPEAGRTGPLCRLLAAVRLRVG